MKSKSSINVTSVTQKDKTLSIIDEMINDLDLDLDDKYKKFDEDKVNNHRGIILNAIRDHFVFTGKLPSKNEILPLDVIDYNAPIFIDPAIDDEYPDIDDGIPTLNELVEEVLSSINEQL